MKKPLFRLSAALQAAAVLSGCCSVTVSESPTLNAIEVSNQGCFLFGCIPLFSGDPEYPNEQVCNWFENTLHVETNIRLLEEEAAKCNAVGYRNVVSHTDEDHFFYLLKRKTLHTSAELIK